MKHHSRSPPGSPGKRRSTLMGGVRRRPTSPVSPVGRPYTAAAAPAPNASRGGEALRVGEAVAVAVAVSADQRSGDVAPEEWVKVSWKKGECREEIKLIAEASGLGFDAAQIVALCLYNHFYWLSELRERSEKLFATVSRERRFSLSLVRHPVTTAAEAYPHDGAADTNEAQRVHQRMGADGEAKIAAEPVRASGHHTSADFSHYVRGLCALCNNSGNFDQTLAMLFRAYSKGADDDVITRDEVATILANHVVYADSEDPTLEQERVYRWLKRQFIHLTKTSGELLETVDSKEQREAVTAAAGGCREPCVVGGAGAVITATGVCREPGVGGVGSSGGVIGWESARQMLRRGPSRLESSLAIDLARLSKDLWAADLVDIGRTSAALESLRWRRRSAQ